MSIKLIGLSAALALLASTNLGRAIIPAQRSVGLPPYGESVGQTEERQLQDGRSGVDGHDLPAPIPRARVPVAAVLNHPERKRGLICIWRASRATFSVLPA